ncbi:MAG TPA: hypothetical protein VFO69_11250 [Allosphingosinicella sp.]|nr:hypothetical protein [Allosphingosinicella sp.]
MMRIQRLHAVFGAACLACVPPTVAVAMQAAAPQPLVEAFAETCRRGFPDLQLVRQSALAAGWVEQAGSPEASGAVAPATFQKGPWTLFLSAPEAPGGSQSCRVAGTVEGDVAIGPLASAASVALGVGPAQFSRSSGAELARWRSDPSVLVQASVSRAPRSASLQVRVQP